MKFEEKEIISKSEYKHLAIKDLGIGESICFYLMDVESKNSQEFGEFSVCVGLEINEHLENLDQVLDAAECASFVPNTQLSNMLDDKLIEFGNLYRITKEWDKGTKFSGGKVAKGYGYKVVKLTLPLTHYSKFAAVFKQLKYKQEMEETEQEVTKPASFKARPRL